MFKCSCWSNFFHKKNKVSQSRLGTDLTGGVPKTKIKITEVRGEYFSVGSTFSHQSFYYKRNIEGSPLERSKTVRDSISDIYKANK